MSRAPGILELAGLAARSIAVELVLFEAFGRWIATTSDASAKPVLAAASRRHAWHAELWRDRFPLIPDAGLDDAVAAARAMFDPMVEALARFDALVAGAGRLAVVDHAAVELTREYQAALTAIDPLLDAPTARVLTLVLADLNAPRRTVATLTDHEELALEALQRARFPTLGMT